ncbi:MAG: diguanylate cyclase [Eubacterium sp.]|nr:diguanylate cyclase [Eubacterium sp.]
MKVKELDSKVYVDSLTNVKNKGAFTEYTQRLQKRLDKTGSFDFAIGMFDCDNLKRVNDVYGHDKGDVYLKGASRLLCHGYRDL